jgi:gas vesicle protein
MTMRQKAVWLIGAIVAFVTTILFAMHNPIRKRRLGVELKKSLEEEALIIEEHKKVIRSTDVIEDAETSRLTNELERDLMLIESDRKIILEELKSSPSDLAARANKFFGLPS